MIFRASSFRFSTAAAFGIPRFSICLAMMLATPSSSAYCESDPVCTKSRVETESGNELAGSGKPPAQSIGYR
jgi:hypothetical protein